VSPARILAAIVAFALANGCALIQKSKPIETVYYTPEQASSGVASRQAERGGPLLRLGLVAARSDLGQRIAFGDGAYQIHYYDNHRWTLRPEVYVRRALTRALFEEAGFRRDTQSAGPALDVEVLAFQEVKAPGRHEARVALSLVLSTDHVLLEDRVLASQPVEGNGFEDFISAMARALNESSNEVARRVGSALQAAPATDEPHSP
jgi:cholesterol transport system auxiliary component